jgi:hypothetical protein
MKRIYLFFSCTVIPVSLFLVISGCKKEKPYALPVAKDALQNDCIKRTIGPNMVTQNIEFAYAMALPRTKGKLLSAEVEASIAGAPGTFLENRSFSTGGGGNDVAVVVGSPSVTSGTKTTVTFTVDTNAATLRYYYVIPEAARSKTVSFTFTVKSSDGETATYSMGPYTIAKMDMARNLTVTDGNAMYISIGDTAVYNNATVAANAAKVDLIYLYRVVTGITFAHALVAPAANPIYLPGVTLPTGVNRDTKERKVFNLQDHNLSPNQQYGIYIDDVDFQQIDLSNDANFAINLKADAGVWVETADHKYRAYIFVHSVNNGAKSALISIKRYPL